MQRKIKFRRLRRTHTTSDGHELLGDTGQHHLDAVGDLAAEADAVAVEPHLVDCEAQLCRHLEAGAATNVEAYWCTITTSPPSGPITLRSVWRRSSRSNCRCSTLGASDGVSGRIQNWRNLIGSVAERVVRLAHCPVIVLKSQ